MMTETPEDIRSATGRVKAAILAGSVVTTPNPKRRGIRHGRRKVLAARNAALNTRASIEAAYDSTERVINTKLRGIRRSQVWHILGLHVRLVVLWVRVHWIGLMLIAMSFLAWWWRVPLLGWTGGTYSLIAGWISRLVAGGTP